MSYAGLEIDPDIQYPSLFMTLQTGKMPESYPVISEIDYGIWDYRSGDRYVMIRDDRYKLTLYRDLKDPYKFAGCDDRVLFDLENDPGERVNLASNPECGEVMKRLIETLDVRDICRNIVTPVLMT
jgi:arylsulfatase A-like enzyme